MSLSKTFSDIIDQQRSVLYVRKEIVQVKIKYYEAAIVRNVREQNQEVADFLEKILTNYCEQEMTAIEYLSKLLSELQTDGGKIIADLEAKAEAIKNG